MSNKRSEEFLNIARGGGGGGGKVTPTSKTATRHVGDIELRQELNTIPSLGRCFFSRHRLWQTQMVEQQMQQYRNHRTAPFSRDSQEWFRNLDANSLLVIKDPYNPNNNVGRSCFGIYQVRAEWQRALKAIHSFAEKMKSSENSDLFQKKFSALGAFFSTDHHRRVVQLAEQLYKPSGVPVSSPPHIQSQYSTSSSRNSVSFDITSDEVDEIEEKTKEEEIGSGEQKEDESAEEETDEDMKTEEIREEDKEFKIMKRVSELIEDSAKTDLDLTVWNANDCLKFRNVLSSYVKRRVQNAEFLAVPTIENEELEMYRVLSCNHVSQKMRIRFVRLVLLEHACQGYGEHEILIQMLETLSLICGKIGDGDKNWIWKYMTRETVLLVNEKFELSTRDDKDVKLKTRT